MAPPLPALAAQRVAPNISVLKTRKSLELDFKGEDKHKLFLILW